MDEHMKKLLLILILIPVFGISQSYPKAYYDGIVVLDSLTTKQTTKSVCELRGHVSKGWATSTLAYCEPLIYDEKCHSALWVDYCNSTSYECARCNKAITENGAKAFVWQDISCIHTLKDLTYY
jgi:hypothetical protein